jgi:hypothetical protein
MKEQILYLAYFLIAILSYQVAPNEYSIEFCQTQVLIYVIFTSISISFNKAKFGTYFNAITIFLFVFFATTFLHSAFYVKVESLLPSFRYSYNKNIVNTSIAIAQIGIASFLLGSTLVSSRLKSISLEKLKVSNRYCTLYQNLVLVISVCWAIYVFFIFFRTSTYVIIYPKLTLLLLSIIAFSWIISILYYKKNYPTSLRSFISYNKINIIGTIIYIIPFLYLGSRTNVSIILMIILSLCNKYIFRLKTSIIILFFVISFFLMGIVSAGRISKVNTKNSDVFEVITASYSSVLSNENIFLYIIQDYVVNSKNLYDAVNLADKDEYLYGMTYVPFLFSFIPFLPTLIISQAGFSREDLDTSHIMTNINNSTYGLGTHLIGDIYLNGGIILVIALMGLLGFLFVKSEYQQGLYSIVLSCSLYGFVLMLPRISPFAWIELFYMLVIQILILKSRIK